MSYLDFLSKSRLNEIGGWMRDAAAEEERKRREAEERRRLIEEARRRQEEAAASARLQAEAAAAATRLQAGIARQAMARPPAQFRRSPEEEAPSWARPQVRAKLEEQRRNVPFMIDASGFRPTPQPRGVGAGVGEPVNVWSQGPLRLSDVAKRFITPVLPTERNPLRRIPMIGPSAAAFTSGLTSPLGIGTAAAFPGATAYGTAAGIGLGGAGQAVEEAGFKPMLRLPLGINVGPRGLGEAVGGLWGGPGGRRLPRPTFDTQAAAQGARAGVEPFGLRRAPEVTAGREIPQGRLVRASSEGMYLTNDIPARTIIESRLADIDKRLVAARGKAQVGLVEERATLRAQRELDDIRNSGLPVEEQLKQVTDHLDELQMENLDRSVPFRGRYGGGGAQAPQFGPEFKEWQRGRMPGRLQREAQKRATGQRFPELTTPELNARERVFREFADNARIQPAEDVIGAVAAPKIAAEPTIGRRNITPGQRPVETAGPLLERGAAEAPPPREPPPTAGGMPSGEVRNVGLGDTGVNRLPDTADTPTSLRGSGALDTGGAGVPPPREPPTAIGGGPSGIPPEPVSWEVAVNKLKSGLKESARRMAPAEVERSLERRQRLGIYQSTLRRELAAGTPSEEALSKARAALGGEYSRFTAPEFGLTEGESEALWRRLVDYDYGNKTFKQVNAAQAMQRIASGEPLRRFEIRLLREVFGDEFGKLLEMTRYKSSTWDKLVDSITMVRTVLSAYDVSYPFRQGAKVGVRHNKEFFGNIGTMIKAYAREGIANKVDDAIRNDDLLIPIAGRHGGQSMTWGEIAADIDILRPLEGGRIGIAEEGFLSNLARRIPGVRASERAFITYGNKLRSDISKQWVQKWIRDGAEITPKKLDDLGRVMNRLTGRGTLGQNVLADTIQALGWAPKYRASGPQAFLQMFHKDADIRRIAIENMLAYLGLGTALLTVAKISGVADVEIDPRSTDFGKMRFGKFRLNIWGTDQVLVRNIAQGVTGEKKMDTGDIRQIALSEPLQRYLRSGLSPENALAYDLLTGENYSGQAFRPDWTTMKRDWDERVIPLAIQDIKTTWEQEGPLTALITAPGVLLGASTSAYEPSYSLRRNEMFKQKTGREYNPESAADRAFAKSDPDLTTLAEESRAEAKREGFADISLSEKSKQEIAQLEEDQGIIRLAQQGLAGDKKVAARWSDARGDFLATRAGIYIANRDEERLPKTEAGKLADEYYRLNPKSPQFMSNDGEVDWDRYDAARQAILNTMSPADAAAIQDSDKFQNPDAERFDRQYRQARDLVDTMPSKYKGVTAERAREIDKFVWATDEVPAAAIKYADKFGHRISEKVVAQALAQQKGDPDLYRWYINLRNEKKREALLNPEYDRFLKANYSTLNTFYSWFYDTPSEMERLGFIKEAPSFGRIRPIKPIRIQRLTQAELLQIQQDQRDMAAITRLGGI